MTLARLLDSRSGPTQIVLVRHGQSRANVADAQAREQGAERLTLHARDADVELTEEGQRQADAVGSWLAAAEEEVHPTVVLSSPYRRAAATAERAVRPLDLRVLYDERLRERSLGAFDGLTRAGIEAAYPEEAERREELGKFYYRPPSGESWADVVLRIRSLLADVRAACDGTTVWMFTHQAVIMSFRYALEGLTEHQLLEVDRTQRLGNASMTRYTRGPEGYELVSFAGTEAVDASAAPVTHDEPEARDGRG